MNAFSVSVLVGGQAVLEHLVDLLGDDRNPFGRAHPNRVGSGKVSLVHGLVEVFPMEIDPPSLVSPTSVDSMNLEFNRIDRKEIALGVDRVAHGPTELVGQGVADNCSGSICEEGPLLALGKLHIRIDFEEIVGIDGKLRQHLIASRMVVEAAEPHRPDDGIDPFQRSDSVPVGIGQDVEQRNLVASNQTKSGIGSLRRIGELDHDGDQGGDQEKGDGNAAEGQQSPDRISKKVLAQQLEDPHGHPIISELT